MNRNNITISRRRQRDETQIENRVGKGRIVFENYSLEGARKRQPHQREQRSKGDGNQEIEKNCADYSVIRDTATSKNGLSDNYAKRESDCEPRDGEYVKIIRPRVKYA